MAAPATESLPSPTVSSSLPAEPDEAEVLSATAVAASPIAWASPATRLLPSPAVMTSLLAALARVAALVCVAGVVAQLACAPPTKAPVRPPLADRESADQGNSE